MFKYLFKALLSDGTIIEQNQEDRGSVEGKNCFYDVLQNLENVRAFAVYNQETGEEWLINLETGEFEHNQSKFKLHGNIILTNIRLIWFIKREMVLDVVNTKVLTNQITSYNFGFQANDSTGKNQSFILTLE